MTLKWTKEEGIYRSEFEGFRSIEIRRREFRQSITGKNSRLSIGSRRVVDWELKAIPIEGRPRLSFRLNTLKDAKARMETLIDRIQSES